MGIEAKREDFPEEATAKCRGRDEGGRQRRMRGESTGRTLERGGGCSSENKSATCREFSCPGIAESVGEVKVGESFAHVAIA